MLHKKPVLGQESCGIDKYQKLGVRAFGQRVRLALDATRGFGYVLAFRSSCHGAMPVPRLVHARAASAPASFAASQSKCNVTVAPSVDAVKTAKRGTGVPS